MRKLLFIFSFTLTLLATAAQSSIQGLIIDPSRKPVAHANVLLLTPKDSSLVKGMLTKEDGTYAFENIAPGKYLITSTHTGYKNSFTPVFQINNHDNLKFEPIKLNDTLIQLKDINVTVKKPLYEQKVDRLVINVAGSITSAGSTALDVLERSPGIIVDRINNSLSINGKGGVIVMMNGKRNYMEISAVIQMLAGIPSGNIDRIEIITTPPANFDAEGNAGIINIVMKANNQFGTNGSYTISAGYNKAEQNAVSLNINHRKGKINVFANYSFSRSHVKQFWTNYHAVTFAGNFLEDYSESNRDAIALQHDGQAGIDYEINKKTIIGALVTYSNRNWDMEANNVGSVSTNNTLDTTIKIVNHELHTTSNYGININLQHTFTPEGKLTINADYLNYNDGNPNSYTNSYYDNYNKFLYNEKVKSGKKTPLKFWVGAIDYTKKVSKKVDIETGVKAAVSKLNNDVQVSTLFQSSWIVDTSLSGYHNLHESIAAAYYSFGWMIDSTTNIKAGLRYEYTSSNLASLTQKDIVDRHYGTLFPSFFFLHTINEKSAAKFSYSRRIWRPSFTDLAPWVIFYDPKTFQTGNPALQPAIADAFNASYTYKNKILSLSYMYIAHPIALQPKIDETTNKLISLIANSKSAKYFSIDVALPFTIAPWWNMQNNISGRWTQSNSFYKASIKSESINFSVNSTQTFILPENISLELSGFYFSGNRWGLYRFGAMGSVDFGAQKKLLKSKSALSFNIRNILNSQISRYSAVIPEQNLIQRNRSIYSYTNFSLSFTHSFGNDKLKGKRERSTGAEDERGRVN
ncbi:MAG: hypothetical protein JWN83_1026 [Chitinophagaceae bacterium]|nr:hypothetical protein [Chitinophagaceae bacterium]